MHKIGLIFQREFLNRVQKKSFLIAAILIPLIFPAILAIMIYVLVKQEEQAGPETVQVLDNSGKFIFPEDGKYAFINVTGDLEHAKTAFRESDDYALLYIPEIDLANPQGIVLYTKENPGFRKMEDFERLLEDRIRDLKLESYNIDKSILDSLHTIVRLSNINVSASGEEKAGNKEIYYGLGFLLGILIYMFVLIYGMQIML